MVVTLTVTPAQDNENNSGLNAFAGQTRSIVVYPTGSFVAVPGVGGVTFTQGWNYWDADSPDIAYLEAVVAHVAAEHCVDPDRVHADGISMGGLMSERLLCEAGDTFASTSGHATNDVTDPWVIDPRPARRRTRRLRPAAVGRVPPVLRAQRPRHRLRNQRGGRLGGPARLRRPGAGVRHNTYGPYDDYACAQGRVFRLRSWTGLGHAYPQQYSPLFPFVVDTPRRDRWISELSQFYDANKMP